MIPELSHVITPDRFASWAKVLQGVNATPVLLVAVGHGEHEGETHLVAVEDLSTDQIALLLRHAWETLERKGVRDATP